MRTPDTTVSLMTFAALKNFSGWLSHGFIARVADVDVRTDRETALARLADTHRRILDDNGMAGMPLVTVRQVHGADVAVVDDAMRHWNIMEADALATNLHGVVLGIYVADCCPIYLVDGQRRAIALVHSGRKGTELGAVRAAIRRLHSAYGTDPGQLTAVLGPCIRPPHYEVDIAMEIVRQCREAGVLEVTDCGENTGADVARYYSYRREQGRTGRMLAFLALK